VTRRLQVYLVEDEPAARAELRFLVEQAEGVEVVGEAGDADSATEEVLDLEPDVCFVDIQIPGGGGLQLAARLKAALPRLHVVFATAFAEHAVQAFELEATDYVLKPFAEERVQGALERVRARVAEEAARPAGAQPLERLAVERARRTYVIDLEDALFFGTDGGLVYVQTRGGERFGCNATLAELEDQLDARKFFRCHREFIVNLGRVREIIPQAAGTYRLVLDDEGKREVPVARTRVRGLRARLPW
jgi:two-component system, LytTR family, response regulator LytT